MTDRNSYRFTAIFALVLLVASPASHAATSSQMQACKVKVLNKDRFRGLPMAAVDVYQGSNRQNAHWTIRWDGLKAEGNCVINKNGNIKTVNVKQYSDGRGGGRNNRYDNNRYDDDWGDDNWGDIWGNFDDQQTSSRSNRKVTVSQMQMCKLKVLNKDRFRGLPMAAIDVYQGSNPQNAHWTIRWDGLKAEGNCVINSNGNIKTVNVKQYNGGRGGGRNNQNNNRENSGSVNGFYYDQNVNEWRDPGGRICYSCTPENGFPDRSRRSYDGW